MTGKFLECITEHAADLDKVLTDGARETYQAAFDQASETLSPTEADRAAGKAVLSALEKADLEAKRQRVLAVRTRRAALESAARFKTDRGYTKVKALGGGGGRPPKGGWTQGGTPPEKGPHRQGGVMADWLKELVDGEGGLAGASGPSIKGRYQAIRGSLDAMMADLMDKFETVSGTSLRHRALLDNVGREAFGEASGDAGAKALADAWSGAAEHARKLFNAAGGAIGKLEGWGLPQSHDALAVRAAGRDGWVEQILPRLDRAKMIDRVTELPFTDKRLRVVLGETWDTIVSHGAFGAEAGEPLGKGKLANRRAEHRFLAFKGWDDWKAYQRDFGSADPYAAMMHHLDGMARDIAQMQVLGPNPTHQFEWLKKVALAEADAEKALPGVAAQTGLKQAQGDADSAERMYGLFTGELAGPYGGADNAIARVGAAVRAGLAGVQLGSAVINDVASNPVFAAQTRAFAGLSKRGEFTPWLKHLASATTRAQARRAGFILESARVRHAEAIQRMLRAQTVGGAILNGANAFARMLPTWINRAGLLEPNLHASRWAFQHEFMGRLHDLKGKSLAVLAASSDDSERAFGAILQARGFTEADWQKIRSTPPETPEAGASFISPMAVGRQHGEELGWRVAEMIEREVRQAVPEASLWAQAQLIGHTRPGTIQGEAARSLAAYRSFTVTQTYRWAREYMHRGIDAAEAGGAPWVVRAAMIATPLLIGTTLGGVAALWMKDIVKGNDPRPFWDEADAKTAHKRAMAFAAAALAQGGGQGILGDFFTSVQSRAGKSSAMTALGAPAGLVGDTWNLTAGNLGEAMTGQETHAGREAANYLRHYAPPASLWWSRAAWNRAVIDQLQRQLDPDAAGDFQRRARRLEREQGQGEWWPEGSVLPQRAPDFAGVAGSPP